MVASFLLPARFTTNPKKALFSMRRMKEKKMTDEEFIRKYEANENQTTEDFIRKHSATQKELEEIISYLIQHREMMRDVELERLEAESKTLLDKLKKIEAEKMTEEIKCFKNVLALQKRLLEENDKPRD